MNECVKKERHDKTKNARADGNNHLRGLNTVKMLNKGDCEKSQIVIRATKTTITTTTNRKHGAHCNRKKRV